MHVQITACSSCETTLFQEEVLNAQLRDGSFWFSGHFRYLIHKWPDKKYFDSLCVPSQPNTDHGFPLFYKCHSLVKQQAKCYLRRNLKIILGNLSCVSLPNCINVKMSFSLSFFFFLKGSAVLRTSLVSLKGCSPHRNRFPINGSSINRFPDYKKEKKNRDKKDKRGGEGSGGRE